MKDCFKILLLVFLAVSAIPGWSQVGAMEQARNILKEAISAKDVSYSYTMIASYPNGQSGKLWGTMYLSSTKRQLVNDNNAYTMLYDSHWFYKADHETKIVTIVNLDKEYPADEKQRIEQDVFGKAVVMEFVDSLLFRFGRIKSYTARHDTLRFEFEISDDFVKSLTLAYDNKHKCIVDYGFKTFSPTDIEGETVNGIEQTVLCNHFRRGNKGVSRSASDFFDVKGGQVKLKKYTKYKVDTKL